MYSKKQGKSVFAALFVSLDMQQIKKAFQNDRMFTLFVPFGKSFLFFAQMDDFCKIFCSCVSFTKNSKHPFYMLFFLKKMKNTTSCNASN